MARKKKIDKEMGFRLKKARETLINSSISR